MQETGLWPVSFFVQMGYVYSMYSATTHNITVTVKPSFLEQESRPQQDLYLWTYTVRIENKSQQQFQLRARSWEIIDGRGQKQHVHGAGVIGEQPIIPPGGFFEYTSGTPLPTPSGFMHGTYSIELSDGSFIDIDIPAFSLDIPGQKRSLN